MAVRSRDAAAVVDDLPAADDPSSRARFDEAARTRRWTRPARLAILALLLALVWFGGLGHRKLIKADEGRYAEIPREMVATGDWLTPRLNGLQYFEKPPLQYWATAAAYVAFGPSEWTSRLWAALTGFAGVLVVGFTGTRLWDRRAGLFAATALASTLAYFLLGHFDTLDMGLTFFLTTTLCAVLLARRARSGAPAAGGHCGTATTIPRASSRGWMLLAWAALALAVLSKGPVAVVLAGGALVVYLAVARDWTLLRMLESTRGLALFALIVGPWFVAVSKANPGFAHFFFVHEHVQRFLSTESRREGPLWYFVPVVVVGLLPWLTLLPKALADGWRAAPADARDRFSSGRLLIAYLLVVFVFFSLSGSKLPSYVLPLFPAAALLTGHRLASIDPRALRRHLWFVVAVAVTVAIAIQFVPLDSANDATDIARFRNRASLAMLPWLVGAGLAVALSSRRRVTAAIMTTGIAALVGWASLVLSHETLGRGISTYDLARAIQPLIRPDTTIYSVGTFEHTLDFYLARTVVPVAFRDELDFGLTQEPQLGIASLTQFATRWNAEPDALAVMSADVFATLTRAHLPMRVVARDGRRIVVARPDRAP